MVSRIITRLSKIMAYNAKHHVHFLRNVDEWKVVQDKLYKMYKMPRIGGCIYCTHITIQNPGGQDLEVFRNRKGYYSLNIQVSFQVNNIIIIIYYNNILIRYLYYIILKYVLYIILL